MKKWVLSIIVLSLFQNMNSQELKSSELPYYELEESQGNYTPGVIVSRMIDGLGFRYYWATDQIRESDLNYKPSKDARTYDQTIDHVLDLSRVILNCALQTVNDGKSKRSLAGYEDKREETLRNLKRASSLFLNVKDFKEYPIVFKTDKSERSYPFGNSINGPIEDAVWHCGQLVSMRRASGNPLRKGVNFLSGKVK